MLNVLSDPVWFVSVATIVGLCIGSFLNVVIHRLPKMMEREWLANIPEILEQTREILDRSAAQRLASEVRQATAHLDTEPLGLALPRSRCPSCSHRIAAWENIPVLSWLLLRGKCSACRSRISVRYPLVELLAGLGAAYAAWRFGFGLKALGAMLFIWGTIALALIDQATGFLPDDITLPMLWAGLLLNAFGAVVPLHEALIGAAGGYLSLWLVYWGYKLLTGKEGMGYGDFKMNAAVGAFLGWKLLPLVILVSSVVGVVFGVAQMLAARGGWDGGFKFHFGPYIAIAGIVSLFWADAIMTLFPAFRIY